MKAGTGNTDARLEVLVPGLLGPLPVPPQQAPATPVLDLLLARGDVVERPGTELAGALLAQFGAAAAAPYALAADAVAAGFAMEPASEHDGFWMHADPVHLRPDRDRLRLFDARHLGISRAEADALVAEVNAHFSGDGLRLVAPAASRWYLAAEQPPVLETVPLERVIGRSIDGHLPTGPDARRWARLLNEAQMLLFQSPVNRAREAAGRPAVNGLWTWGGGRWQPLRGGAVPDRVLGGGPLAAGLAAAAGAAAGPLPEPAQIAPGSTLAVIDRLRDAVLDSDETAWAAAADALEAWLAPALGALRSGALAELILDDCDGRGWRLRRGSLRRLWRRPRALVERLETGGAS
jgi:hypothetical protein